MCTALIWFRPGSEHPLRIAFNRDQAYTRQSTLPRIDTDICTLLSPIDVSSGGTWLGVNSAGIAGFIVNSSRGRIKGHKSRGLLLRNVLLQSNTIDEAWYKIQQESPLDYSSCYLLLGDINYLRLYTFGKNLTYHDLMSGYHIISDSSGLKMNQRSRWLDNNYNFSCNTHEPCIETIRKAMAEHQSCKSRWYTTCCHSPNSGTISSQYVTFDKHGKLKKFYYLPSPPCSEISYTDYSDFLY